MGVYPVLKRNYDEIDPIIENWVHHNSLHLYKEYKEVEVRSVNIVDKDGNRRFQIWIDPVGKDGTIPVHVWEIKRYIWERKKSRPIDLIASQSTLKATLEKALELAKL